MNYTEEQPVKDNHKGKHLSASSVGDFIVETLMVLNSLVNSYGENILQVSQL